MLQILQVLRVCCIVLRVIMFYLRSLSFFPLPPFRGFSLQSSFHEPLHTPSAPLSCLQGVLGKASWTLLAQLCPRVHTANVHKAPAMYPWQQLQCLTVHFKISQLEMAAVGTLT